MNFMTITKIASKVAAELKPMLEPAKPNQAEPAKEAEGQKEIEALRKENAELKSKLGWIESELQAVKNYLRELVQSQPSQESQTKPAEDTNTKQAKQPEPKTEPKTSQPEPSQTEPGKAEAEKPVDEGKAEQWLRNNLKWFDQTCQFKQAKGRTWRQMAENKGEKIAMNGKGLQPPRAYLHAIESWESCKPWARLKAKVALEIGKNGTGSH